MVDGVDMSTRPELKGHLAAPREEIEAFDFDLNDKLRALYGKVDQLTLDIAELRRKLPEEAYSVFSDALEKRRQGQQAHDEHILKETDDIANALEDDVDEAETEARLEQLREIKKGYYENITKLGSLIQSVPESKTQIDQLDETLSFLTK